MLITLPIYMPLVQKYGVDQVWFGVMFLICMQLGLLLRRMGLLLMDHEGRRPAAGAHGSYLPGGAALVSRMSILLLALVFFVPQSRSGCLRCSCNGKIVQGRSREAQARRRPKCSMARRFSR